MPLITTVAALIAALIHLWFFVLESVLFVRPEIWARFGIRSAEAAEAVRPMAFNHGFYNLFLAAGVVIGIFLAASGSQPAGRAVVLFACACMAGAGLVLGSTNRRLLGAAALQAIPPLVAVVAGLALSP